MLIYFRHELIARDSGFDDRCRNRVSRKHDSRRRPRDPTGKDRHFADLSSRFRVPRRSIHRRIVRVGLPRVCISYRRNETV